MLVLFFFNNILLATYRENICSGGEEEVNNLFLDEIESLMSMFIDFKNKIPSSHSCVVVVLLCSTFVLFVYSHQRTLLPSLISSRLSFSWFLCLK
jgi:hypothetical protein